jgi:hypothetical protein
MSKSRAMGEHWCVLRYRSVSARSLISRCQSKSLMIGSEMIRSICSKNGQSVKLPFIGLYFSFIYFGYVCRLEPGWTYKTDTNKRLGRMNAALPFCSFDIQSIPPHTIKFSEWSEKSIFGWALTFRYRPFGSGCEDWSKGRSVR